MKLLAWKIDNENDEDGKTKKRCKGVKKNVVDKSIAIDYFEDCLFSKKEQMRKINVILSRGHELFVEESVKVALIAFDDMQIILENGIDTLLYGFQQSWKDIIK